MPRRARWRVACLVLALCAACAAPRAWDSDRAAQAAQRIGPRAVQGLKALQAVLGVGADADDSARLEAVNQFFNRQIVFRDDEQVWGVADYWASPLETLGRGAGDCEDFAIAKYFALLAGGTPASHLRLVYVRLQLGGAGGPTQAHMVLAYYAAAQAEPLILDNLVTEIRPASRRPDLTPVFSFNSEGLWQGAGAQSMGDPVSRLSRWRDVLAKARAEGFL
ncbi:MAG: transglutaminase-like cysteine peptidase [Burkholderiaceae bacterium]